MAVTADQLRKKRILLPPPGPAVAYTSRPAARRVRRLAVLAAYLATLLAATGSAFAAHRAPIADGIVATLSDRQELLLEAVPRRGEGLLAFARRFTGTTKRAALIAEANGNPKRLLRGRRYRVPFSLLTVDFQLQVVGALFEEDRAVSGGWRHQIPPVSGTRARESLWHVAEWFTGRGDNYRAIRQANGLTEDDLEPGQVLMIPAPLLRPAFRAHLPPSSPYYLEYGSDRRGDYAVYRLKTGEALYSSVVARFTGRVFADDVNALASEVAERSGIRDVTDIPIGYRVKIPFELLLPEFLPSGHPRRREYEDGLIATARFSNQVRASRLQGVTVIIDAGHGGNDVGASMGGVWESVYVYDIMLRTRKLIEETTAARVVVTTQDGRDFRILDRDRLPTSRKHRVLTTPNYPIQDSRVGVHLRWYLVNSVFRQAVQRGDDPDKVVFISIHADSLHPSLRGAMAYVPGARYRGGEYGKRGSVYASRREVRERPRVAFSRRELVRSEGLSRDLAGHIIDAFRRGGLAIHPDKPIREKVIRKRRPWVPAVLRYSAVPAELLLEVCNLANAQDRKLMQSRAFRQQVAAAIAQGILDYYGHGGTAAGGRVAATAAGR